MSFTNDSEADPLWLEDITRQMIRPSRRMNVTVEKLLPHMPGSDSFAEEILNSILEEMKTEGWYADGGGWKGLPRSAGEIDPFIDFLDELVQVLPEELAQSRMVMDMLQWSFLDENAATLRPLEPDPKNPHFLIISQTEFEPSLRAAINAIALSDRRRYVPILTFNLGASSGQVALRLVTRHSVLATSLDIDTDPLSFIHILLVLFSGELDSVGFDNGIYSCPNTQTLSLVIKDVEYEVTERLTGMDSQFKRGTTCWKACSSTGDQVIIKDWWEPYSGNLQPREDETLESVSGTHLLPTFIASEVVYNSPVFNIKGAPIATQVRMVSSPCASPLCTFVSAVELFLVFKDGVEGKRVFNRTCSRVNSFRYSPQISRS